MWLVEYMAKYVADDSLTDSWVGKGARKILLLLCFVGSMPVVNAVY